METETPRARRAVMAGRGIEMVRIDAMDFIQKISLKSPLSAFDATALMRTYEVLRISDEVLFCQLQVHDYRFFLFRS